MLVCRWTSSDFVSVEVVDCQFDADELNSAATGIVGRRFGAPGLGGHPHELVTGRGVDVGEALRRAEASRPRSQVLEPDLPLEGSRPDERKRGAHVEALVVLQELIVAQG